MKIVFAFFVLAFGYVFALWKYGGLDVSVMTKFNKQYEYEKKAIALAKENRILQGQISDLKYEISQLETKTRYLSAKAEHKSVAGRAVASVPKQSASDLVAYEVYKWTPEKLLAIGEKELHFKNYEKSSQFYHELIERFPGDKIVSDRVLFGAGVASFETGKHYDWTIKHLSKLIADHPKSEFYRGAKLWLALAYFNKGDHAKFLATVEEFRLKYRNTDEWKILSRYYEDISYKIKK